jgi:hypothetical protein
VDVRRKCFGATASVQVSLLAEDQKIEKSENFLNGLKESVEGSPKTMFKPDPRIQGYPSNLDYFNAQ